MQKARELKEWQYFFKQLKAALKKLLNISKQEFSIKLSQL
jgi:hypothetical protein